MADSIESLLQDCSNCGTRIDVSDEEPFAQMHCPGCGAAMRVRKQFGSFELQELMGAGGMGAVYRALDNNLHRQIALKLLRREFSANPEFIRQFAHEAAITASINHPNVVKVYSSGSDHGLFYIAMELVDKGSLDDLMTLEKKVAEIQGLDVGIQIAQGLNAAYERGLIHRDVKPGNILFADAQTAKIVDFGLAVPLEEAGMLGGEIWGTPYYVAPEKLDNKPEGFRSDMYSLAAALFHALAGRPPHESDDPSIAILRKVKSRPVSIQTYAPELSGETAYAINRALQHDPDKRFASYQEFIEHLQYAKDELRKKAAMLRTRNKQATPPPKKSRNWSAIGMIAAVVVGGSSILLLRERVFGPAPDPTPAVANIDAADASTSIQADYKTARQKLIEGDNLNAAEAFRSISSNIIAPQPLRTWAAFHAGMASFLAGDTSAANTSWQEIVDQGPFSTNPEDQKLAQFFIDTATTALSTQPIGDAAESQYSRSNYELLAVMVLAGKSWTEGKWERAAEFFHSFQQGSAEAGNAFTKDYQPITERYLTELLVLRRLNQAVAAATSIEQQQSAIAGLREGLATLKLDGPHKRSLTENIARIEGQIAAYEAEQTRIRTERESADAKALAETQTSVTKLLGQFKFAEARAAVAAVQTTSDKGQRDRENQMRRAQWLSDFKQQLIKDVSAAGAAIPLLRRTGAPIPGTVARATDQQLEFKTPYGVVPVAWTDVAPDSLLQMARAFIRPDATPERKADRAWLMGSFALFAGKLQDAKALFTEATTLRPDYKSLLSTFPELADH